MSAETLRPWHPTEAERAVCESLPGGCPHGAEWMESLERLRDAEQRREASVRPACDCAPDCAERIACTETIVGHLACGWCDVHNQAQHICLCRAKAQS